jgi:CysZ protein
MSPPSGLAPRERASVPATRQNGFAIGLFAPFHGFGTLLRRPGLWPLAAVPVALFAGLAAGGSVAARAVFRKTAAAIGGALGHGLVARIGATLVDIIVALVLIALTVIVAALIVPALASPFMDVLAGKVDRRRGAAEPFARQLFRSIRVALAGLLFTGLPQLALWMLALAMPALAPVWVGAGVLVASFGLALDALDWPLSRRGLGVRARLAWMRRHPGIAVGMGFGVWLLSLVPGLSIVALPAIVVGAVHAVNRTEPAGGAVGSGA